MNFRVAVKCPKCCKFSLMTVTLQTRHHAHEFLQPSVRSPHARPQSLRRYRNTPSVFLQSSLLRHTFSMPVALEGLQVCFVAWLVGSCDLHSILLTFLVSVLGSGNVIFCLVTLCVINKQSCLYIQFKKRTNLEVWEE